MIWFDQIVVHGILNELLLFNNRPSLWAYSLCLCRTSDMKPYTDLLTLDVKHKYEIKLKLRWKCQNTGLSDLVGWCQLGYGRKIKSHVMFIQLLTWLLGPKMSEILSNYIRCSNCLQHGDDDLPMESRANLYKWHLFTFWTYSPFYRGLRIISIEKGSKSLISVFL